MFDRNRFGSILLFRNKTIESKYMQKFEVCCFSFGVKLGLAHVWPVANASVFFNSCYFLKPVTATLRRVRKV